MRSKGIDILIWKNRENAIAGLIIALAIVIKLNR